MSETVESVRLELQRAADERAEAERRRAAAMDEIAALVALGFGLGLGVAELARLTGLSRPTVYALLGQTGPRRPAALDG